MAAPGALVLVLFFAVPLAVVCAAAFQDGGAPFLRTFGDPLFWRGLQGSLVLALAAGAVSLLVGSAVAFRLAQLSDRRRTLLLFFISLPLTFSGLVVAYGFILAFGRAGFVTLSLATFGIEPAWFGGFIYSPEGLAFAYCYYLVPRVVLLMLPVLVNFDRQQILAAESLGAGRLRALLDVLVPEVLPTAVVAFCLVAAIAFGAYGTALALVGTQVNILPLLLYSKISAVSSDFPAAAALSLVLLAVCATFLGVGEVYAAHRRRRHAA
jgi:putative spermidine/putrescine transport system permease protein